MEGADGGRSGVKNLEEKEKMENDTVAGEPNKQTRKDWAGS